MKIKILIAAFIVAVAVLIVYSQTNRGVFQPAQDLPSRALIYVQIADLPAFVKLWNESKFKEKYLASDNFHDFTNNHLGRKLASRWQEFNDAAGFPIDLNVLSSIAGNQAAIAVYDIGKLEFVFIAPVSDEIFAATQFAQNSLAFAEETLADGTIIRRASVIADRGRQKQELLFTHTKGRFVLATSEKLLAQTLANVNGGKTKNRLADEPLFKILSEKIEPHTATVWLNQTMLNDDYYFKHYWLMSDAADLKNLRAGIFDFELAEGKLVERRKFLLEKASESVPMTYSDAAQMLAFVPRNAPFYRLQPANRETIAETVEQTIFAREQKTEEKSKNRRSSRSSFGDYDYYSGDDYESLSDEFDETIDEIDVDETVERGEVEFDFSKTIQAADPQQILTFTQPKLPSAPLFAEFQRAAIINFAAPEFFSQDEFESMVAQKFAARLLIAAPGVKLNWEAKSENNFARRELKSPMLGWSVAYCVRGNYLFLSNDADFLRQVVFESNPLEIEKQNSSFNALTVINFDERERGYDRVFAELDRNNLADDFFTNNIVSLLDSISEVKNIEIKENYLRNTFEEEIILNYK